VPIQLTQCRFPELAISNAKILIYFLNKNNAEAILSNSSRKLLLFEITKMLKKKYYVIYDNLRHTFVPCGSGVHRVVNRFDGTG